jgi:hypothetical protein
VGGGRRGGRGILRNRSGRKGWGKRALRTNRRKILTRRLDGEEGERLVSRPADFAANTKVTPQDKQPAL